MREFTKQAYITADATSEVLQQTHEALMFFVKKACERLQLPPDEQLMMLAMVASCEADRALSSVVHVCDESRHDDECSELSGAMAVIMASLLRGTLVPTLDKLFAIAEAHRAKEAA